MRCHFPSGMHGGHPMENLLTENVIDFIKNLIPLIESNCCRGSHDFEPLSNTQGNIEHVRLFLHPLMSDGKHS